MDFNAYLTRIGYSGPINNSHAILKRICELHYNAVPFDVLGMHGADRIVLNLETVYKNIVIDHRGGTCYEVNRLFQWLLRNFGFQVDIIQCQWFNYGEFSPKFNHLALLVSTDDDRKWLVDVCWGGVSFKHPLEIKENEQQIQETGVYRLVKSEENDFIAQYHSKETIGLDGTRKRKNAEWITLYKFDCTPRKWSDFQESCDFNQYDDRAFFAHNTMCSIFKPGCFIMLWGWCVRKIKFVDPKTEEIMCLEKATNPKELGELLSKYFGINKTFHLNVQDRDQNFFHGKL